MIVKVEPFLETINLSWRLGLRCNYDCMYCPASLHDNTSTPPELDQLKTAWNNFYSKVQKSALPIKLNLTGGEVTANKNFLPFVKWIRSNFDIFQIAVTTNGSASKNYYLKLCSLIDTLSFSIHSEFINEQLFFDTVIACNAVMHRPKKSMQVIIMNEYWNQDRILLYQKWCNDNNIEYSINVINYSGQTRTFPIMQGKLNLDS
jgi:MoaA/NifB/PqqE/SkfB family radical SAM enzyme